MNIPPIFAELGKPISREKGDFLFKQGDLDTSVYVVTEGLLKAYYLTVDGKEFIKSFIAEGEFIGSLSACSAGESCTFNLTCIEACRLLRVSFTDLQKAATLKPESASFLINGLIRLAIKKEQREFEFLCLAAPERFALFKERSPNLVNRLTQNDIARYLGITPVSLSRIKQRETSGSIDTEN